MGAVVDYLVGSMPYSQILKKVQASLGSQKMYIYLTNKLSTLSVPVINIQVLIFAACPKVQRHQQMYSQGSTVDVLLNVSYRTSSRSISKWLPTLHGSFLGH